MDMLSVKKVRLHGMTDSRWTTRDKITQYKGLINLFKRDTKISNLDKSVTVRKEKRAVNEMKRQIARDREKLDYAIFGDRQLIRNALLSNKAIKLAYERLEPEVISEHIGQQNFSLRKKLDLLTYTKLKKAKQFCKRKVDLSVLHDRLVFEKPGSLPVEMRCNQYTSLVQDAILKKNAAIIVNEVYHKIIDVMKKDQMYFDQILNNLKQDSKKQAKCMYDTIVLGQLAVEYLDDRREEFKQLEAAVYNDMTIRRQTVKTTRQVVESLSKNIKFYIRRDSDINLPDAVFANPNTDIQAEIGSLTEILDRLTVSFQENTYLKLFDVLLFQDKQRARLSETQHRTQEGRETLENRVNHANLMHIQMLNNVTDDFNAYKNVKNALLEEIREVEEHQSEMTKTQERYAMLLLKIKVALQQMEQICKVVSNTRMTPFSPPPSKSPSADARGLKKKGGGSKYKMLVDEAIDIKGECTAIIDILTLKFTRLANAAEGVELDERTSALAEHHLQSLTEKRAKTVLDVEKEQIESLVDSMTLSDEAGVPTRGEIKAQSKEICSAAAGQLELAY